MSESHPGANYCHANAANPTNCYSFISNDLTCDQAGSSFADGPCPTASLVGCCIESTSDPFIAECAYTASVAQMYKNACNHPGYYWQTCLP